MNTEIVENNLNTIFESYVHTLKKSNEMIKGFSMILPKISVRISADGRSSIVAQNKRCYISMHLFM